MALSAFVSKFAKDLEKAETPGAASAAEAAQKFSDAFIAFFENAQVNGAPMNPGTSQIARSALVSGVQAAFEATGGPTAVCDLLEAAFFAYWNGTPITAMFTPTPTIASIAPGGKLSTAMSSISAPDPSQPSAKGKVANAILKWLTTPGSGPVIAITPPPPGVTAVFM